MQEVYLLTAQKQMSDSSDEVAGGGDYSGFYSVYNILKC